LLIIDPCIVKDHLASRSVRAERVEAGTGLDVSNAGLNKSHLGLLVNLLFEPTYAIHN
jgi:hypothetical protein